MTRNWTAGLMVFTACALIAPNAAAGALDWKSANWRLELMGWNGLDTGDGDRSEDWGSTDTVEYEVPLGSHFAFGLRAAPLFYYDQDNNDDDMWGVGFGPTLRLYSKADEQRGFFGELGLTALYHSEKFTGNGSDLNFVSELGVGYKFKREWHIALKWRHISNAGIDEDNSGANAIGLGLGYSF